jgi:hypothetical protein
MPQFLKDTVPYATGIIRWGNMSADRNTSGAKGLLYSVYFKFVKSAKKVADAIHYLRRSSCVLAKNNLSRLSLVSLGVYHTPDYGAHGAFHSERLSMLYRFSEEECSDTLW